MRHPSLEAFDTQRRRDGRRQMVSSALALTGLGFVFAVLTTGASTPVAQEQSDPRITQRQVDILTEQTERQARTIADLTQLVADCQTGVPPCVIPQSSGGPTLVTRLDTRSGDDDDDPGDSDDDGEGSPRPNTPSPSRTNPPKPDQPPTSDDPVDEVAETVEDVTDTVTDLTDDVIPADD
jgi:hypothetical protein